MVILQRYVAGIVDVRRPVLRPVRMRNNAFDRHIGGIVQRDYDRPVFRIHGVLFIHHDYAASRDGHVSGVFHHHRTIKHRARGNIQRHSRAELKLPVAQVMIARAIV